jgi:BirA family biotin operon repressor/biotin-[acetyl-CoA-carboxylase] ligase
MNRLRNFIVKSSAASSPATGTVVRADELSNSSGRFGRTWHAPSGGLYLALVWADTFLPEFSRLLPFAIGIACCETLNSFEVESHIKWVNDVHVREKKVAGVLCEMVHGPGDELFHLAGIGINVNTMIFPEELEGNAASLRLLTGRYLDLDEVCSLLLARLQWNFGLLCYAEEEALASLQEEGGQELNILLKRWQELSDTQGKTVQYGYDVQKEPMYRATAIGVDAGGGLIMELQDGSRLTEYSGEILYCSDE